MQPGHGGAKPPFRPAPVSSWMHPTRTLINLLLGKKEGGAEKLASVVEGRKDHPVFHFWVTRLVLKGQWVWVDCGSLWAR